VAVGDDGSSSVLQAGRWLEAADESDDELFVAPCSGSTLDIGCGPGRLVLALQRHGVAAHGIDISPDAVRCARTRGASASQADVFAPLPEGLTEGLPGGRSGEGQWVHALLADGNVGIGGRPHRLLGRIGELLVPGGQAHVELHRGADNGGRSTPAPTDTSPYCAGDTDRGGARPPTTELTRLAYSSSHCDVDEAS
jgi:SAM-dependent methyltransferase